MAGLTLAASPVLAVPPVLDPIGDQSVDELTELAFTATASDTDIPAQTLTFTLENAPTGASITTGGDFSWTPTEAQGPGSYDITVRVTDDGIPTNETDFEVVTITVSEVNVTPVLDPIGNQSVQQESLLTFTATASDTDDPGNTLTFSLDSGAPTGAGITIGGVFTWTPTTTQGPGDFNITVRVTDNGTPNLSAFETITVTVSEEPNVPPVLGLIGDRSVDELTELAFTATATDANDPAQTLTFSLDPGAPAGAGISAGGDFSWTPTEAQGPGSYPVTVRVTDNGTPSLDDSETFTVTVNDVNVAPTANPQTVDTDEDTAVFIVLTGSDPDGDTLSFAIATDPANGSLLRIGPNVRYTPDPGFNGTDSFTFTVSDGEETSLPATVTINVAPVNDAPTADPQSVTTDEDVALPITLTGSDPDDDPLTFAIASQPANGVVSGTPPDVTYTPNADYNGSDSFTFTASDGSLTSLPATVSITVNPVNDPPTADPQSVTTDEEVALPITLTGSDPDDDPLAFAIASQPANGVVSGTPPDVTYTPNADYNGPDSFTFTASDAEETSPPATVTIDVDSVNDPPLIEDQSNPVSTPEETPVEIMLTDLRVTDPDSDQSTFVLLVQDGTNYTRVGNTITPVLDFNGDLTVPVTVSDGEDSSAPPFNVTVSVTPVNDAPTITGQVPLSTPEDTSLVVALTDVTVADPDSVFPDEFVLLLQDGTDYTRSGNTITPVQDFNGTLSVGATVSDGFLASDVFFLAIDVTAENDDPVLVVPVDAQFAIEGSPFSLTVGANFDDADGDTLTFTATGLPASGNLVFDEVTGTFSGTPALEDARDNDPYPIVVTTSDNQPGSVPAQALFDLNISALDRANVTLDIEAAPDPAVLSDQLSWTMTASNPLGPQGATNVEITGSFVGAGLTITPDASCTMQPEIDGKRDFDCAVGALPVGESVAVNFMITTSAPGDVLAYGTASNADPVPLDPNTDDNSAQKAVGVAEAFSNGVVQVLGTSGVLSVTAGDVNGDGAADLVAGTAAGQPLQVYLSDGFRDFADAPIAIAENGAHTGVALADFDNNDTLDLVVATSGAQTGHVFANDGIGNFSLLTDLSAPFAQDVAVGDFDADGNADIAFATMQGNPIYLGDGTGQFVLDDTLGSAVSNAVAVARFDGDNRDDLVFANSGGDSQVWIKNAGAGFSQGASLPIGDAAGVAVGDFDGVGGPDLAFGRIPADSDDVAANPVLLNDGSGGFPAASVLLGTSATNDIHAGDVNRDGVVDLVFVNASGVHQVWSGTGSGFDLWREQIVDDGSSTGVLAELGMADAGEPGGVDLAMGGAASAGLGVFLNDGFGNLGMGDAVPPVITLSGATSVDVPSGSSYSDAGATAEDNIDGDISGAIVVSSNVNTSIVGNYSVTYNVTDRAGNAAETVARTVNVTPASGTGGGGGGAIGIAFLVAMVFLAVTMYAANHAIMRVPQRTRKNRGE